MVHPACEVCPVHVCPGRCYLYKIGPQTPLYQMRWVFRYCLARWRTGVLYLELWLITTATTAKYIIHWSLLGTLPFVSGYRLIAFWGCMGWDCAKGVKVPKLSSPQLPIKKPIPSLSSYLPLLLLLFLSLNFLFSFFLLLAMYILSYLSCVQLFVNS